MSSVRPSNMQSNHDDEISADDELNLNESVRYHHGNLRLALINASIEQIKMVGVEKLSLRNIARSIGVSQTAPYRHFKNKNELLVEVAIESFNELFTTGISIINPSAAAMDNLKASGIAYIQYAMNNPEKYRLLFSNIIQNRNDYPHLIEASEQSFQLLVDLVQSGIESGDYIDESPLLLANNLWTQVHGLASLILDGFYHNKELSMSLNDFIIAQIEIGSRALNNTQN